MIILITFEGHANSAPRATPAAAQVAAARIARPNSLVDLLISLLRSLKWPAWSRDQANRLLSVPMPDIDIDTSSPALRKRGGLKPIPTPAGVPVAMTSPGWRVRPAEIV